MMNYTKFLGAAAVLGLASVAQGALIAPVSVALGLNQSDLSGTPANMFNDLTITSDTSTTARTGAPSAGADGSVYRSTGGTIGIDVTFTFDLGSDQDLDNIVLWNYGITFTNGYKSGIQDFTLDFATEAVGTAGLGGTTPTITIDRTYGSTVADDIPAQVRDFTDVTARYVRINVTKNWTASSGNAGLAEIRFNTVVPEPSSTALIGLAGLGLLRRRRA